MEFRYRAGDRGEAASPPPPPPQMEFAFSPHPLLHPMAAAALRRQMLKQQIRDEILAGEAAERREIEVEVRRELDMERAMPSFLTDSPLSQLTQVNESEPSLARVKRKGGAVAGSSKVAKPGEPTKVAPASERNLHCALCEVSTTNEKGLKEHLNGRKHRANVTSLSCKGTWSKARVSSAFVTARKSVRSSDSTPKLSATSLQEDTDRQTKKLTMIINGKRHKVLKKDKIFWCELCSVQCNCTELMVEHLGGKKHIKHIGREGEPNAIKSGKEVARNAEAADDMPTT